MVSRLWLVTHSCNSGIWRRISGTKSAAATWLLDSLSITMPIFAVRSAGLAVAPMVFTHSSSDRLSMCSSSFSRAARAFWYICSALTLAWIS